MSDELSATHRVARYVEMTAAKPLRGADRDLLHCIHTGTEWEAELRLSDIAALMARAEELETIEAALSDAHVEIHGHRFACSQAVADYVKRINDARIAAESRLRELEAEAIFGGEPIVHNWPECGCAITPPKQCDNSHQWAWQLEEMQRERDDARNRLRELASAEPVLWTDEAEECVEYTPREWASVALIRRPEMPS